MDERLKFIARLLEVEKMAVLCREFDISRKTGYKIYNRYKGSGLEGLTDRSRRPYRQANQLPMQIEQLIASAGCQRTGAELLQLPYREADPRSGHLQVWRSGAGASPREVCDPQVDHRRSATRRRGQHEGVEGPGAGSFFG